MIIKKRESKESDIKELISLLSLPLPDNKRFLVERELRFAKSGDRGENDSAYFIDFHFGSSKNWAVIHDFRLEYRDQVAQIDHLMINRLLEVYVLETKNFSYAVKITDGGEFEVSFSNKYFSIESPIEQNKRHLIVLEQIFKKYDIMPKRLGITLPPTFRSYVLVSTKSRVIRPSKDHFDTSMVIKADTLRTQIDKEFDNLNPLSVLATASKIVSSETIKEMTERLASLHKPMKMDYRKRFGIDTDQLSGPIKAEEKVTVSICPKCGSQMILRTAKSGGKQGKQFWGCRNFPRCRGIVALTKEKT